MRATFAVAAALLCFVAISLPAQANTSVDELVKRLDRLEAENKSLRARVDQLERRTASEPQIVATAARPPASIAIVPEPARVANAAAFVVPSELASWSGVYVGTHAGFGWERWPGYDKRGQFEQLGDKIRATGAAVGMQAGGRIQTGALVLGVEGDFSASTIGGIDYRNRLLGQTTEVNIDWLGSVRGVAGFAFNNTMVFASAGWAIAGVDAAWGVNVSVANNVRQSRSIEGRAYGGGIAFAVTPAFAVRAEFLRYAFDDQAFSHYNQLMVVNPTTDVVRVGLDWRLN